MQNTSSELKRFKAFLGENRRFFLFGLLIAIAFRVLFLVEFRHLTNDSLVYGTIAKNWLQHGIYGQNYDTGVRPTYIRLPGYPIFLILVWLVAGVEHYTAVLIVQAVIDVVTCFVIADLARRVARERAAKIAFILAALCPLLANYVAVALTETLAIFCAALALDAAVAALEKPERKGRWILCGLALGGGILLRPDGGMLLAVVGLYVPIRWLRATETEERRRQFRGAVIMGAVALAPLVPWTIRNWISMHRLQPLAPVYANNPDEFVPRGFHQWVRTWIVDYASVEDIWFNMDGGSVDLDDVPRRAFDNADQLQRTAKLFKQFDDNDSSISPAIDAGFEQMARERIAASPFRFYVKLPFLRGADLWLRPHTEMLYIDPHWWRYWESKGDFAKAGALAAINLFYLIAAAVALLRKRVRHAGVFVLFLVVRTVFLAWMPNPEPRYTLECYPAVLAMAAATFERRESSRVT